MSRHALVIGISRYDGPSRADLEAAASEARQVADLLRHDDDKQKRWSTVLLTDDQEGVDVSGKGVQGAIWELFHRAEPPGLIASGREVGSTRTVDLLLYFNGHAAPNFGSAALQGSDGHAVSFRDLIGACATAGPASRSITLVLDCCMSGDIASVRAHYDELVSTIPENVTILTASRPAQDAHQVRMERGGVARSLFTEQLIGALTGAAADLLGNVTALSAFAHASTGLERAQRRIAKIEQTPLFKCNVDHAVTLRRATPRIETEVLAELARVFPEPGRTIDMTAAHEGMTKKRYKELHAMDPDSSTVVVEPDGPSAGENYRGDPHRQKFTGSDAQKENDFLKAFRDAGLLETYGGHDLYWLMDSKDPLKKWVRLNALGHYYWELSNDQRLGREFAQ